MEYLLVVSDDNVNDAIRYIEFVLTNYVTEKVTIVSNYCSTASTYELENLMSKDKDRVRIISMRSKVSEYECILSGIKLIKSEYVCIKFDYSEEEFSFPEILEDQIYKSANGLVIRIDFRHTLRDYLPKESIDSTAITSVMRFMYIIHCCLSKKELLFDDITAHGEGITYSAEFKKFLRAISKSSALLAILRTETVGIFISSMNFGDRDDYNKLLNESSNYKSA